MKKTVLFLAAVLVCVFIAGCGVNNRRSTASPGNGDSDSGIVGVWETKYYEDSYFNPSLTLREDNTFTFRVNLLEGFGNIDGTYEVKDSRIYCEVEKRDFGGFVGDDIDEFVFLIENGELIYESSYIGMTNNGDHFVR